MRITVKHCTGYEIRKCICTVRKSKYKSFKMNILMALSSFGALNFCQQIPGMGMALSKNICQEIKSYS